MAGWKQNLSIMKEGGGGNETDFMVLVYECWLAGWRDKKLGRSQLLEKS